MMTNLFSTFDPATSENLSLNWVSTSLNLVIMPLVFWTIPSRNIMLINLILTSMNKEFKTILGKTNQNLSLSMITLFTMILSTNMMGLLPYIFTSSSHLLYTLTLALPFWMSMMMFGWINKTQEMFAHLTPSGTPGILMPFMVAIETISNMIRPGSLAVRLTANMIAGHLLMSLLGNMGQSNPMMTTIIILAQITLMMFETAVSFIQAYVFSILTSLYSAEV